MLHRADVLVLSWRALWPLHDGASICGYHMATALARQGVRVAVATVEHPQEPSAELDAITVPWPEPEDRDMFDTAHGWSGFGSLLRDRYMEYDGATFDKLSGAATLVHRLRPKAVIGVGLRAPMMLRGISRLHEQPRLIWYGADELLYYHLTCMRREPITAWPRRLRAAAQHMLLENLFVRGCHLGIGVSPTDTFLLRTIAGVKRAVTIRNGVDTDYFKPAQHPITPPTPRSLVFWGRMDFTPNVDAVCWFAREVWPKLHERHGDATWSIVGMAPDKRVLTLDKLPGVTVTGPVDDIRPYARAASMAILPMRCGAGIKNKLLEAAAMGLAIVASPRAVAGLTIDPQNPPMLVCRNAEHWRETILGRWRDLDGLCRLGRVARQWACKNHSWDASARKCISSIGDIPRVTQWGPQKTAA